MMKDGREEVNTSMILQNLNFTRAIYIYTHTHIMHNKLIN